VRNAQRDASSDDRFSLEKWYLDIVTDDAVHIVYAATMRFGKLRFSYASLLIRDREQTSPTPIADAQAGDRGRSPKGRVGRRGRTTSPQGKPTFLTESKERRKS